MTLAQLQRALAKDMEERVKGRVTAYECHVLIRTQKRIKVLQR